MEHWQVFWGPWPTLSETITFWKVMTVRRWGVHLRPGMAWEREALTTSVGGL